MSTLTWSETAIAERERQKEVLRAMTQAEKVYAKAVQETTKAMAARERTKATMRTPEGDCPCEGCELLRTKIGTGVLTYLREFIAETAQAVTKGKVDQKTDISLTFEGPDWRVISGMSGAAHKSYVTISTTVGEIADMTRASILLQKPDLQPLREAYADDPVIYALLDWIEKRTA